MMNSQSAIVALAVLVSVGATSAYAASPQPGYSQSSPTGSDTIKLDEMRASKLIGSTVYDRNNQKVGDVHDIVVEKDGRVSAVVLSIGSVLGIGGKDIAVNFNELISANNRLSVNRTEAELKQATNYNLEEKPVGSGSSSPLPGEPKGMGNPAGTEQNR